MDASEGNVDPPVADGETSPVPATAATEVGAADTPPPFYGDEEEEEEEKAVDVTEIHFKYTKPRSAFGRQTQFLEDRARIHCGLRANRERYHPLFQQKKIVDKGEDTMTGLHDLVTNTARVEYRSVSVLHGEGGWSKEINVRDKEQLEKARKKLQKEDSFIEALPILLREAEQLVKHNNALGLLEPLTKSAFAEKRSGKPSGNVVAVYSAPSYYKRPVSRITFAPDGSGHMATAYCPNEFDPTFRTHPCEAYFWEVENATRPEGLVRASSQIVDLRYHPQDWFTICGALFSGQVCTWDNRVGPNPQSISGFDVSHEDVCTTALWTGGEDGHEFFSSGLDGNIIWWDDRNLSTRLQMVTVDPEGEGPVPVTALEYDSSLPDKFLVGTQFGQVMIHEKEGGVAALYKAHRGPVRSVHRNPVFSENFMSCGGYVLRIFAEECKESGIMWTKPSDTLYAYAQWLPARPSCMAAGRIDGCLEVWDLLVQGSTSLLTTKITDDAISTLCPTSDGRLIAAGTVRGDIRLVELSSFMNDFTDKDKDELKACFSREQRREQGLADRLQAFKDKEAKDAEGKTLEKPDPYKNDDIVTDKNFFEMLAEEKARQGVNAFPDKREAAEAHNQMLIEWRMEEMKRAVQKAHKGSVSALGAVEAMGVNQETLRKANAILEGRSTPGLEEDDEEEGEESTPGESGGGDELEEDETVGLVDTESAAGASSAPQDEQQDDEE